MSEWYEEFKANKKKQIVKSGESHHELDMICPYCGQSQTDLFDRCIKSDWEEHELQCDSCERHFVYKTSIVFDTRTQK